MTADERKWSDKIGLDAREDARATGIAFGWVIGTIILGRSTCVAACEICDGLEATAELVRLPDPAQEGMIKVRTEVEVWSAFRAQALLAGCEHIHAYVLRKTGRFPPTAWTRDYQEELAGDEAIERCAATGIAYGFTRELGFIGGCCFCAYALRVAPSHASQDAPDVMQVEMGKAACQKTCPHWFDYVRRYLAPPPKDEAKNKEEAS